MALGDIYEQKLYCRLGDQLAINVRHWYVSVAAGTAPTQAEWMTSMDNLNQGSLYRAFLPLDASYRGYTLQQIFPGPFTLPSISLNQQGVGSINAQVLPRQTAGLGSLSTSFAGRAFRGRVYFAFPTELHNTQAGEPDTAYQALAGALLATWHGSITAQGGGAGGISTLTSGVFHRASNSITRIEGVIVRPMWATQRRRGSFGQPNTAPF